MSLLADADNQRGRRASGPHCVRVTQSPDGNILQVGIGAVDPRVEGAPVFSRVRDLPGAQGATSFDTVTMTSAPLTSFGV